jgi:type IV pilus assembly protein PilY1
LSRALEDIAMRTSSASNVAANSVSLDAGARVFNASYVSGSWTGDLSAREVTAGGVSNTPIWNATIPQWNTRRIYTYSSDDGGTAFPTSEQLDLLAIRDVQGNIRYDGSTIADYVKGDQGSEMNNGGPFRVRTRLLGDIVGSSPAYVPGVLATPSVIYVGANDGMLHAFDASNGRELFAYIPGLIDFGALSSLSSPEYAHKFFVDGPVVVSSASMIPSRRVLVGTLGRGGKGVYALDVTSPQSFNESHVMWERGETPGGNMGLVLGRPLIAEARGTENAVVVLGNGVNSASDKAVLVVLDAISGEVIREIDTEVGSAEQPNGLFVPTAVLGPDGRSLAYVYAGDMLGNVWKFDLTSDDPDEWEVVRLFTASDEEGNSQPISAGITIATHPVTNKRWIFFGTGRYLTSEDVSWSKPQSIYGFMDEGTLLTKSELQQRTVTVTRRRDIRFAHSRHGRRCRTTRRAGTSICRRQVKGLSRMRRWSRRS